MLDALHDDRFHIDRETLIVPGLTRTYRFMQLSDSHMSPDSPLDDDATRQKAAEHRAVWMGHGNGLTQEENFEALAAVGHAENVDLFLLAGDMTDFPSVGTADEGTKLYHRMLGRYLYVPGNHEQGVRYPDYYAACTGGTPALQVVELDELTLVGVDNGCHTIDDATMDALERVAHGNKPVVLLHHVPVDCDTLHPAAVDYWQDVTYFLFGASGEGDNIDRYNRLVREEKNAICAVVAGHLHFAHVDIFANGVPQYVSAPTLAGYARILEIKG